MKDIADHCSGGRSHDSDHLWKEGKAALSIDRKEAFGCEGLAPLFEEREQCSLAGDFHFLDDDLVFRAARMSSELASRDNFGAILRKKGKRSSIAAPDHRVDAGILVLQCEIAMTGGMALESADLAADA